MENKYMNNLKMYSDDKIIELILKKEISTADLTDSGICPTCFDIKHNNILYGSNKERMLYEDKDIECFLVGNPRAIGHAVISTKKHYKDMMEIDDKLMSIDICIAKEIHSSCLRLPTM